MRKSPVWWSTAERPHEGLVGLWWGTTPGEISPAQNQSQLASPTVAVGGSYDDRERRVPIRITLGLPSRHHDVTEPPLENRARHYHTSNCPATWERVVLSKSLAVLSTVACTTAAAQELHRGGRALHVRHDLPHAQAVLIAGWAPSHDASPSLRALCERIVVGKAMRSRLWSAGLRDRHEDVPTRAPPSHDAGDGSGRP